MEIKKRRGSPIPFIMMGLGVAGGIWVMDAAMGDAAMGDSPVILPVNLAALTNNSINEVEDALERVALLDTKDYTSPETETKDEFDWSMLPQSRLPFVMVARTMPGALSVQQLLRHPELNPRDEVLSAEAQELLSQLIHDAGRAVERAETLRSVVEREEMSYLIDSGQALTVPWIGPSTEHFYLSIGTEVFEVHTDQMVESARMETYVLYAGQELGAKIVYWFRDMGLCPDHQVDQLIEALFQG